MQAFIPVLTTMIIFIVKKNNMRLVSLELFYELFTEVNKSILSYLHVLHNHIK